MNSWTTVVGLLLWAGLIMITVMGCCRAVAMRPRGGPVAVEPAVSAVGSPPEL